MTNSLYFDVANRSDLPFQVFVGGRGVGKTYSALTDSLNEKYHAFMYIRRTASELESTVSGYANPFKRINADMQKQIMTEYSKSAGFGQFTDELQDGKVVGYSASISTFAGLRGADFSDVDVLVVDEFIPEAHKTKIREEGKAFLNMYETINRNREIDGFPPVKVYLLANSISLNNPILLEIGAINTMQNMISKGQVRYSDKERGLYIELINDVPITAKKRNTALYRLSRNTDFSKQALNNEFASDNLQLVKKIVLAEYKPLLVYGKFTIYKHKANGLLYIANRVDTCSNVILQSDKEKFIATFNFFYKSALAHGSVSFDSYDTKLRIENALKL